VDPGRREQSRMRARATGDDGPPSRLARVCCCCCCCFISLPKRPSCCEPPYTIIGPRLPLPLLLLLFTHQIIFTVALNLLF
jgi:hypothetical protein